MKSHDQPVPGRPNLYDGIHRGLRLGHARLIERLSATDFSDPEEMAQVLAELRGFLDLARGHLDSEETKIHPAVAAREPAAIETAHEGHDDHEQAFDELQSLARAVEDAAPAGRAAAAGRLYRRYVRFAADDFLHMEGEETELLGALHRLFDDAELAAIEGAIVSAIPPARMAGYLRLIVPALSHPERMGMLAAMRAALPHAAFAAVLTDAVRPALSEADWRRLDAGLRAAA